MIYTYNCPKCGNFDSNRKFNQDLSKDCCPNCGEISKRVWFVPQTTNNFMPDIKGSSKVSKKIMKEAMSNGVYSTEKPDGYFWNKVKSGEIIKRGNMYVNRKDI